MKMLKKLYFFLRQRKKKYHHTFLATQLSAFRDQNKKKSVKNCPRNRDTKIKT